MRVPAVLMLSLSLAAPAVAQTAPPPIITVREGSAATAAGPRMVILKTPTATCAGQPAATPLYSEPLTPEILPASSRQAVDGETRLAFSIDPDGRTRDIRLDQGMAPVPPILVPGYDQSEDQATLAAWRFPPVAAKDCRLTIVRRAVPIAYAPPAAVAQLAASAGGRNARSVIKTRFAQPGDDCDSPPPLLNASYPDRRKGSTPPGGVSWVMIRWDILPDGRTGNIETLASSGDQVFEAESRRAVGETRFVDGSPRTGCVSPFSRTGDDLTDTPQPEPTDDVLKDCPADVRARFTPGRLTYPDAFRRRGIEGWAIVRYDIASWGQVGAVSVLEAQPAAAFGNAARQVISSGQATPGFTGAVRCTDRIIFRMPRDGEAPNTD